MPSSGVATKHHKWHVKLHTDSCSLPLATSKKQIWQTDISWDHHITSVITWERG